MFVDPNPSRRPAPPTRSAWPCYGRFVQADPIGYGDGMNLYSYTGGDPVNARDPTGTEMVCVPPPGHRAPTCVYVDGDGNGQYTDSDLTSSQESAIANAFAGFIREYGRNQTLSPYGKRVEGSATAAEKTMVRVASQFVGYVAATAVSPHDNNATANRFRSDWSQISHINADRNFASQDDAAWLAGDHLRTWIQIQGGFGRGDSRSMYNLPSDLVRLMFHETTHVSAPDDRMDPLRYTRHQEADNWARHVTTDLGLGHCQAVGGFPACD